MALTKVQGAMLGGQSRTFTVDTTLTDGIIMNPGDMFTINTGVTLTISGSFQAGLFQVFNCVGTGSVVFGAGAVSEVYPEWWGAVGDDATDCTLALEAANFTLGMSGGGVLKFNGTYLASYFKLRSSIAYIGIPGKITLRTKSGTNNNLITLYDDSVSKCKIIDFSIHGNKDNNTEGHGIYLYRGTGVGPGDQWMVFDNVEIAYCANDGLSISGAGVIDNVMYNIRSCKFNRVTLHHNNENGFSGGNLTDSVIDTMVAWRNGHHGICLGVNGGDNWFTGCKTYYNGDADATKAGWYFPNYAPNNHLINCSSQDNFGAGFELNGCDNYELVNCVADSNGQIVPNAGFIFRSGTSSLNAVISAWNVRGTQNIGIIIEGCVNSNISMTSTNQSSSDYAISGVNTNLNFILNGTHVLSGLIKYTYFSSNEAISGVSLSSKSTINSPRLFFENDNDIGHGFSIFKQLSGANTFLSINKLANSTSTSGTPLMILLESGYPDLLNNDAAKALGLSSGTLYRTGDFLKVVH